MRALVQRVDEARVLVDGNVVASISQGLCVFIGITHTDGDSEVKQLVKKLIGLRIMDDENGRMNLSVDEISGEILVVSQFTLYGNLSKGRRPTWISAAPPEQAEPLIQNVVDGLKFFDLKVETGKFREHMLVDLVNNGPATLMLEV